MKLSAKSTTEEARRGAVKVPHRIGISLAFVALASACWLLPVRAQEHAAPAHPAPAGAPAEAPATHGNAPVDGHQAPAATPGSSAESTPTAPAGNMTSETGATHQGAEEHGPGGLGGPRGGEHETGTEGEHAAQPGHEAEGAHGAEGGHGGEHGAGEHKEEFSIHLPTWIYGGLKKFWYAGPATLNADGALGADGQPVAGEGLKGKTLDYTYVDHHAHATPKPEYPIKPTLGTVGTRTSTVGAPTETVTVDGQQITLINPTVQFAYASMFPEGLVVSLLTALTIAVVAFLLTRNLSRVPSRRQTLLEMVYGYFDNFCHELIGPHYKKYVPLIATSYVYILFMNLAGIIPGWMSPTSNINVTAGLAVVVVLYTQIEGIRVNGLKGYVMHFVGEPWWLFALNVPIHVIGEAAKVLSLTIRLFGNIFGEDVVVVILIALGVMFTKVVPIQAPMYLLAIFTSFVQAMVFSILTSVYIALMTTHDHAEGHHGEDAHGHDHGHIQDSVAHPTVA